jgi:predicted DNA-binding protein
MTRKFSLHLSDEETVKLKSLAKASGMTTSDYIKAVISESQEDMTDHIREILKDELKKYSTTEQYGWMAEPKYLAMFDIIIQNGKIYFPIYDYESMERIPYGLVLQNYGAPCYTAVDIVLNDIKLPLPLAQDSDIILCRCRSDKFYFHYGSYSLQVKCGGCGHEWEAYSG